MGNRLDSSTKCELNLKPTKLGGVENGRRDIQMSGISAAIWLKKERSRWALPRWLFWLHI